MIAIKKATSGDVAQNTRKQQGRPAETIRPHLQSVNSQSAENCTIPLPVKAIPPDAAAHTSVARRDRITSHHIVCDSIRDAWLAYRDHTGHAATSPNSYMTLRKQWNKEFGIKHVEDLDGDPEGSLLHGLGLVRAHKIIEDGIKDGKLRREIRNATYAVFRDVGLIWKGASV